MTHALSESTVVVHELPPEFLDKPLTQRFELALQHWLDLYPGTTSIRYGKDHASDRVYLAANQYGPRLDVMAASELYDSMKDSQKYAVRQEEHERYPKNLAAAQGVQLKSWMASDPSVELFYAPSYGMQRHFRKELVESLNYALGQIGCRSHRINLSDGSMAFEEDDQDIDFGESSKPQKRRAIDDNATLVWEPTDNFAPPTPPAPVYEALAKYFKENHPDHPVNTHATLGETIAVKDVDESKWVPMDQTAVERAYMAARQELQDPSHPWTAARRKHADKNAKHVDPLVLAYMASKEAVPLSRNGTLLFQGGRFDYRSAINVGYLEPGRSVCGANAIDKDLSELMDNAANGLMSQMSIVYQKIPDTLMSMAYHAQVVAHQKERAAWLQLHPVKIEPADGPAITKPVSNLQVGDQVGVSSGGDNAPNLWCTVTKREGDVATLFIHNGHWDFQLNLATNESLPHDIVKDFAGRAQVVYTAPIPIKDGAMYGEALAYMNEHVQKLQSPPDTTPSL